MLAEAKETSEKLLAEATSHSEKLVADAQGKSDAIVGEIASKVAVEEATLKTLKKQVSDFKNNVLNIYKKHLETLCELPEEGDDDVREYAAPAYEPLAADIPSMPEMPSIEPLAEETEPAAEEFAFPEFGASKPAEAVEAPSVEHAAAADAFSFDDDDKGNRFGKLDFGDSFTFGAE